MIAKMSDLELFFFGSPKIIHPSLGKVSFRGRKTVALLAYLALSPNKVYNRDHLMGLLWPDLPDNSARNNLRVALSRINSGLSEIETLYILTDKQTAQFNPERKIWLDVQAFTELIEASKIHEHQSRASCLECFKKLDEAIELYSGEFLEDFHLEGCEVFEEWQLSIREKYHLEAMEVLADLAEFCETKHDFVNAVRCTRRQLKLEPLHEDAQRRLMRLLSYQDKRNEALEHFQTYLKTLQTELNIEPEDETVTLYHQIQSGGLGKLQLKENISKPKQVTNNLPTDMTPFMGREEELKQLQKHLQDQRLITLLGMGGIGKTRLALKLARSQFGFFNDGVYLIRLVALQNTADIVTTIAKTIGFSLKQGSDAELQVLNYLKDKSMLLVMDNFEHLLEGRSFISNILKMAPNIKLVITSRQKLVVTGEAVYPVSGLSFPEKNRQRLSDGHLHSAVELFLDTAQRARLDFELQAEDLSHIEKICQLVEGHPLALVLAASWLQSLSCQEIAEELGQGIEFLATQSQDIPNRQRSILATFNHSWQQLSQKEQTILASMSVFRGGFNRKAAKEVSSASLSQITTLLNKSLIQHLPEQGRYELHELMRQFGEEKLNELGQTNATLDAHSKHYSTALTAWKEEFQLGYQAAAIKSFEADFENIRLALQWATRQKQLEHFSKSISSLNLFCTLKHYYQDLINLLEPVLPLISAKENYDFELDILLALGAGYRNTKGYGAPELVQTFKRAYEISQNLDNSPELFAALYGFWSFNFLQGNYPKALEIVAQWRKRLEALEDNAANYLEDAHFFVHYLEGMIKHSQGKLGLAQNIFQAGFVPDNPERYQTIIAIYGFNFAVNNRIWMALNYCLQGYLDKALVLAQKAREIAHNPMHPFSCIFAAWGLAFVCLLRNEHSDVLNYAAEVIDLSKEHEIGYFVNHAMLFKGFEISAEDLLEGISLMEKSLAKGPRIDVNMDFNNILLIRVLLQDRQSDRALKHITETLAINEKIGLQRFNAELLCLKGEVLLDKALLAEAQQCFRQAINTSKQQGAKLLELRATKSLSNLLVEQGKIDEARSMLAEVYGWFTEGFDTLDLLEAKEVLGKLEHPTYQPMNQQIVSFSAQKI